MPYTYTRRPFWARLEAVTTGQDAVLVTVAGTQAVRDAKELAAAVLSDGFAGMADRALDVADRQAGCVRALASDLASFLKVPATS